MTFCFSSIDSRQPETSIRFYSDWYRRSCVVTSHIFFMALQWTRKWQTTKRSNAIIFNVTMRMLYLFGTKNV